MTDVANYNAKPTTSSVSEKTRAVMAAILQQWPHTKLDTRDPTGVWSNAIDALSVEAVRYAIGALKYDTSDFAPTPPQFRASALAYSPPAPPRRERIADNGERAVALDAARGMYARKLGGSSPKETSYAGTFDVAAVVAATPIPSEDKRAEWAEQSKFSPVTAWYFEQLEANFARAWEAR